MSDVFFLQGAVNDTSEHPSICIPAFGKRADNDIYSQYIGIDNRVLNFDVLSPSEVGKIRGMPKQRLASIGDPAIYSVFMPDAKSELIFDEIDAIRKVVIDKRWLIDRMDNPFRRLDFAQLSNQYAWFSAEAKLCEAVLDEVDRKYWIQETLYLSRVRFAIETVLCRFGVPYSSRLRICRRVNVYNAINYEVAGIIESLCRKYGAISSAEEISNKISEILREDIVCNYATIVLGGGTSKQRKVGSVSRWHKKITRSDAQRKISGNQRGSITLVKAGHNINANEYFRRDLFSDLDWIPGKTRRGEPIETASVRMRSNVLGEDMGELSFSVSYAENRVSGQGNYSTLLHVGPLRKKFSEVDMEGKWIEISCSSKGAFFLNISEDTPG